MMTWHIHISGQVQGVGFRPFVYQLAKTFDIKGWVNNDVDGVHIMFNASEQLAADFYDLILNKAPKLAEITAHKLSPAPATNFGSFDIVHSSTAGEANLLLTPDFAICESCKGDIRSSTNRRFQYLFTTCTNCGPRYSITETLPYDRPRTTMAPFAMCNTCQTEYENPNDRRYYSQTNSCKDCGIQVTLIDKQLGAVVKTTDDILAQIIIAWEAGKIVAIKGIGGFLLTCDANNATALKKLRQRKHRPDKPFALMYPNIAQVERDTYIKAKEKQALESPIAPIVLLKVKEHINNSIARKDIAPKLGRIGVMLPYTPFYLLLLEKFRKPIVATSGNISHSPIIYQNKEAGDNLFKIADLLIVDNRAIVIPQDDSVFQFSYKKNTPIILRRSRGLAPTFIPKDLEFSNTPMLGLGAQLKSTFSFLNKGNVYISQYLGDLDHYDTQRHFKKNFSAFSTAFLRRTCPIDY